MSSHSTAHDPVVAITETADDTSAMTTSVRQRAGALERWRERVFLDIRSYHYTSDVVWPCVPASLIAGAVMIPWYFIAPETFPLEQGFAPFLLVFSAIGVVIALGLELRSTTSSTSLTLNRFVGSIMLSVYAGGLNLGFVEWMSQSMDFAGRLFMLDVTLALIFYFVANLVGYFMFMIALTGLSHFEPRVPGLISAKSRERLPGSLWGKIRSANKVWKKQEYMHALVMHDHFSDFEALWERDDLSEEALEISLLKAFDKLEDASLIYILQRDIPSLDKSKQKQVLDLWASQPDRQRWAKAILAHSMYQVEADTARTILLAQLEDERDGAQRAALTLLKSARIDLHDEAIAYMERFAEKEHATALYDIKQSSKNPLLTSRLGKLLEHLGARMGGAHGKLSLAQDDSARGGLTSADGQG